MKTILLFAILALSINAIAQNNPVPAYLQGPASKSMHKMPFGKHDAENKITGTLSGKELVKNINLQARELFTLVQQFDSIYQWTWDTLANDWAISSKVIDIFYNSDNYPTNYTNQVWTGASWLNSTQISFSYDANNNQTGLIYKVWNGAFWANVFQDVNTYDANNNLTSEVFQIFDSGAWVNSTRSIYMYDGNNNRTSELGQDWDGTDWLNYDLNTFSYDANHNQLSELVQTWNDLDGTWDKVSQYLNTFDTHNNLLTNTYQTWNGVTWDNGGLTTNTFDANNNQTSQLFQYWDGTTWVNYNNTIYTYNANNNLTNTLGQIWNVSNWANSARTTYTYNANHFVIKSLFEIWSGTTWLYSSLSYTTYGENNFLQSDSDRNFNADGDVVADGDSTYYFFHTVTGIDELPAEDANITVYPNPSNGKFTIDSKNALRSLDVYNLLGEHLYTPDHAKDQISAEIDLTGYGKGIYILTMVDAMKMYNRKVVVQ